MVNGVIEEAKNLSVDELKENLEMVYSLISGVEEFIENESDENE